MPDGGDRRLEWFRQMHGIGRIERKLQRPFTSGTAEGTAHPREGAYRAAAA